MNFMNTIVGAEESTHKCLPESAWEMTKCLVVGKRQTEEITHKCLPESGWEMSSKCQVFGGWEMSSK